METNAKQQVVERVKSANNILITVSSSPTPDQLSAAIGFTLLMTKLNKHSTAVFSGEVPPILEFLQPEKMIEKNTDSLRDFIISLDKAKADKLRYKVEDEMVKIFITPYRTSLSDKDLEFSQGDFNVDVIIALGVINREELDQAIVSHGRILHDATVISVLAGDRISNLGSINWQDAAASSLCEMLVSISESFGSGLMDNQIATAFLTGIVAETERFKNEKTTPKVLTMSAQLVAAGANQQLVATELETPPEPEVVVHAIDPEQEAAYQQSLQAGQDTQAAANNDAAQPAETPAEPPAPRTEVDVTLDHNDAAAPAESTMDQPPALEYSVHDEPATNDDQPATGDQPAADITPDNTPSDLPTPDSASDQAAEQPPVESDPSLIEITHQAEADAQASATGSDAGGQQADIASIHIDEHGNIVSPEASADQTMSATQAAAEAPSSDSTAGQQSAVVPPLETVAAPSSNQSNPDSADAANTQTAPALALPPPVTDGILSIPSSETLTEQVVASAESASQSAHSLLSSQPAGPAMSGAMQDANNEPPDATDILNLPPLDGRVPEANASSATTVAPPPAIITPPSLDQSVGQPTPDVSSARDAVTQAVNTADYDASHPEPIQALNAVPMPPAPSTEPTTAPPVMANVAGQPAMPPIIEGSSQPAQVVAPTAPPATAPPLMPPLISRHSDKGNSFAQAPAPPEVATSDQPPAAV